MEIEEKVRTTEGREESERENKEKEEERNFRKKMN